MLRVMQLLALVAVLALAGVAAVQAESSLLSVKARLHGRALSSEHASVGCRVDGDCAWGYRCSSMANWQCVAMSEAAKAATPEGRAAADRAKGAAALKDLQASRGKPTPERWLPVGAACKANIDCSSNVCQGGWCRKPVAQAPAPPATPPKPAPVALKPGQCRADKDCAKGTVCCSITQIAQGCPIGPAAGSIGQCGKRSLLGSVKKLGATIKDKLTGKKK